MKTTTSVQHQLSAASVSDTGRIRGHNEDTIGHDYSIGLHVLADGMGGYNAGEVASDLAVKTTLSIVREAFTRQNLSNTDRMSGLMRPSIILRDAILRANKIVHLSSKSKTNCAGMGTTIVAMLFYQDKVISAHVGDSRLYRLRKGTFSQLTVDHSLLQELVDRGFYSEEEALQSTNKNFVTRALGVETTVEVDIHEHVVHSGDLYMLCSDGLTDMLEDANIADILKTAGHSLQETAQQLIDRANKAGGRDNISVMLAHVNQLYTPVPTLMERVRAWLS
jgi:protein phosphatase